MKKKRMDLFCAALVFSVAISLFSCCTTDMFSCPYVLSGARVEIENFDEKGNFVSMYFSMFNESNKNIESFTLSFMLYDSEGNNPFIGSNCVVAKCSWPVKSAANIEFSIDLDPYISDVPDEPFTIDYLYVREITYEDGTSWKDPYGMYSQREGVE